jgi:spore coat polysaccharide biosynthesis protein SpsF
MKIVTAIQARTSSTRLPYKVMLPLCGEPLLFRMIERVRRASFAGTIVVATTTLVEDDIIEKLCLKKGIQCFRGDPSDLLDRHYQLALDYRADAIVKIPSDCPLIDPRVIDNVIRYYLKNFFNFDYVSNLHPATYPDGNDVEVMSFESLETAWKRASRDFEREHTTPYIWENPIKFRIGNVTWPTGMDLASTHRWTIDYEEDYLFICEVFNHLFYENPEFTLEDILSLINENPELSRLNERYAGCYWYENHLDELTTIDIGKYKSRKYEAGNYSG